MSGPALVLSASLGAHPNSPGCCPLPWTLWFQLNRHYGEPLHDVAKLSGLEL